MNNIFRSLSIRLSRFGNIPKAEAIARSLSEWYKTPFGEGVIEYEYQYAADWLARMAGYRAMQLSVVDGLDLLKEAPMLHKFAMANLPHSQFYPAVTDFDALPLPSNLIDVVLLHHVLDYCCLPHEALTEAARIVSPSGYLIIYGFNPWSWTGLFKWPMRILSSSPRWKSRGLSVFRIVDWLKLVGFKTEDISYRAFGIPIQNRRYQSIFLPLERFCQKIGLPFGTCYMIVARKQVTRPMFNNPDWISKAINPIKVKVSARVQTKHSTK